MLYISFYGKIRPKLFFTPWFKKHLKIGRIDRSLPVYSPNFRE